ncbi:MAG: DNA-binding protein WhiA [Clostridiales bacterium]|nr:DNA-binding protein WhiA [Clostridiales bacterium]
MSFTSDIKKEIIHLGLNTPEERKAALSAFVRTSGFVGENDGVPSFFIVSETENVAEFFMSAFSETFNTELTVMHATMDRMSGRDKLLLQCPVVYAESILQQLYLHEDSVGIDKRLVPTEEDMIAYVKGAFLGGGSCTLPNEGGKTGYHLEIVFSDADVAENFCEMLEELEMLVHLVNRKDTFVAYIKSKEVISDFLSVIGAEHTLRKFSALVEKRDRANQNNRAQNCMAGNADKTAIAAVKQVVAIKKLQENSMFSDLSDELKQVANERVEHATMSLQELADYLKISKSCLNHRMRRLMELAKKCEE